MSQKPMETELETDERSSKRDKGTRKTIKVLVSPKWNKCQPPTESRVLLSLNRQENR